MLSTNSKDLFFNKSKSWDLKSRRVQSAKKIAEAIAKNINLDKSMHILDFGAGTGLLSYFISDKVEKITAIDNSPSMLDVLREKRKDFFCPINIINIDITKDKIPNLKFDGIVSSMTLHHIEDIKDIFKIFYEMLGENGFIAIADLDKEDGTFHKENIGVFHFGFDRETLNKIAQDIGFKMINFETVNEINKPNGKFPIFLMTALK